MYLNVHADSWPNLNKTKNPSDPQLLKEKMGNSFGCSASGERLVSAARDGDFVEAKMLLDCNPCLAKYSTFGGLNSPLHFAAAKGHNDVLYN